MLTPIEVQNKTFKSGGLGYDKKDVDQFFREVNDDYLRLYSENIDLCLSCHEITEKNISLKHKICWDFHMTTLRAESGLHSSEQLNTVNLSR